MKIEINTVHDARAVFPESGSFDWVPGLPDFPDDPRIRKTPLEVRLRVAARAALEARGYTLSEENPDFLIGFRAELEGGSRYAEMFGDPEKAEQWARELGVRSAVEKGTLIVNVHDPKSLQPIWCGICRADVDLDVPEQQKRQRLAHVVGLMFEAFPPPGQT